MDYNERDRLLDFSEDFLKLPEQFNNKTINNGKTVENIDITSHNVQPTSEMLSDMNYVQKILNERGRH